MDFDIDIMVRAHWRGIRVRNRATRVTYPEDGVSHFRCASRQYSHFQNACEIFLHHAGHLAGDSVQAHATTMKKNHWADLGESTFVAGIWFMYGVYRLFGRLPFRLFLYPVVSYYWLTKPIARQSSMEYLQRIQQAKNVFGKPPGRWQGYRHFLQFGETLLDKLLAIGGNYPVDRVDLSEHKIIWDELEKQQGCLIVTAHLGCLELMQSASTWKRKFKINILVHTAHATSFNRILTRINPDTGVNFLQVTAFNAPTAMMLADRIAAGELIAIAGDRVPTSGDRIVNATFLGKPGSISCRSVFDCFSAYMPGLCNGLHARWQRLSAQGRETGRRRCNPSQ